ncbi:MAG: hypothetical protein ACOVLB_03320 [Candidatus Nanopelagicus sp.]
MPYNFDIAMSATLSEHVVHEMVIKAVEQQTGKKVNKVIVTYDGTKFSGYQVFFDSTEAAKTEFTSSKKFVEERYELATK